MAPEPPTAAGWDYEPLIINAALTGMVPTKADVPQLPVTPEEIARDAQRCFDAGARVVHLHARDAHGAPTYRAEVYAEIIGLVRQLCPELIICVSTSGRRCGELEKRAAVLQLEGNLKPEMASLTPGSLNFAKEASLTAPATIQALLVIMRERRIIPEIEIFDLGMMDFARHLIEKQILPQPHYFNFILGSLGTLAATPANLARLAELAPHGATWSAGGVGRFQFFVNAQAIAMGGHVRVGLEDNVWLDAERREPGSNVALVERLARLSAALGRRLATPAEVRARLRLTEAATES